MPLPSASRRKDPAGAGSALPCPLLPREAGFGAGAGAGVEDGGVVRPYKNEGGGGLAAHLVQLLGGCSDRAAPAGGCPRQGPHSVISPSTAQVSPGSPPSKTSKMRRSQRAARSVLGGLSLQSGARVLAEPSGGSEA